MRKVIFNAIVAYFELQKTASGREIFKKAYLGPMKKFLSSEPFSWKKVNNK